MLRVLHGFSLVELMITLIIISYIMTVITPIITKKLKSNSVTILNKGGEAKELSQECSRYGNDCLLCTNTLCALCEKDCKSDEYKDSAKCSCKTCNSKFENCLKCRFSECTSCNIGYKLKDGLCEICPDGYYQDETGQSICKICEEDYYCQNGLKAQCSTEQGATEGSSSCVDCPLNCIDCKIPTICLACKEGYYVKNGECAPCPIGCATCDSDTNCISCISEHNLISIGADRRCVRSSEYQECLTPRCASCSQISQNYCRSYWYSNDTTSYPEKIGCCHYPNKVYQGSSCGSSCANGTSISSLCSNSGIRQKIGCTEPDAPTPSFLYRDECLSAQRHYSLNGTINCNNGKSCATYGTVIFNSSYACENY